jgi:hypothetical protein
VQQRKRSPKLLDGRFSRNKVIRGPAANNDVPPGDSAEHWSRLMPSRPTAGTTGVRRRFACTQAKISLTPLGKLFRVLVAGSEKSTS